MQFIDLKTRQLRVGNDLDRYLGTLFELADKPSPGISGLKQAL